MATIDLERIKDIEEELENLEETEVLFVEENGVEKYAIMNIHFYDMIEEVAAMLQTPQVNIAKPEDFELSYDEYERVKNQIMDIVEKTLMPKPEKLN
ncbi:MAG: hypothetical protein IKF80_02675 [Erysipelotrichaceae bacterium]|nr:hypothetical protein [Erysipelotrichaceae bacterium]